MVNPDGAKEFGNRISEVIMSEYQYIEFQAVDRPLDDKQLAFARGTDNYKAAADILADLREAIGGKEGDKIARRHAAHLAKKYPTLNQLKSSLRKRGLLD